ncbi:hypothetical protein AJ85_14215 [Alkalihalobacillus alcalophilus ATCC 27647 = CGMCC 1.3604]|uniref:Uncharacterized protein n=1 Tax=Alkalihalobacillus alcalophilus ATCC 27647 = CGMCC 1.3604 TaxID=1218173 RepID=A0A4S4JXH8_ALKAL|nr:hypothetical protein AJ85_14215 [Alkalihalobacillus alcalophilus ATCC 27647 = CGMCC 1.3604]
MKINFLQKIDNRIGKEGMTLIMSNIVEMVNIKGGVRR